MKVQPQFHYQASIALKCHAIAKYLECLGAKLASFYTRLGFVGVSWRELPPSLKRKFGVSTFAASLLQLPLSIMQYRLI
jgi:hypothetical protein